MRIKCLHRKNNVDCHHLPAIQPKKIDGSHEYQHLNQHFKRMNPETDGKIKTSIPVMQAVYQHQKTMVKTVTPVKYKIQKKNCADYFQNREY